nr:ribonuclease H-like domain, reverse transcriptase, RNA-dependent DNA polymerase [Tanacetum cinerariifolium]
AKAVKHAIYILNRVPTRALIDKTPYEALYNRKLNLENLRIFGCTAYAKITTPHLKKLDDRSIPLIYLGVEEGSKAYTSTQDTFWASFMIEGVDNENTTLVNIDINGDDDNTYQEPDAIPDPVSMRFMQDPKEHHLKAVKQVIQYIKGTKEHGIIYKKEGGCKIIGYSDSSYRINTDQGKGTTGIVFYFEESPITWCTQKQPTLALSSCESKFMTATRAASIALVRNPVFHERSKHIDICYHFICECVENGHINVEHVSGELQRADILTKALPRLKFVTM